MKPGASRLISFSTLLSPGRISGRSASMPASACRTSTATSVEYRLTGLGLGLGAAFCGVWLWAAENLDTVEAARESFDRQAEASRAG